MLFLQEPFVEIPDDKIREALKVVLGTSPSIFLSTEHLAHHRIINLTPFLLLSLQTQETNPCLFTAREARYDQFPIFSLPLLSLENNFAARTLNSPLNVWIPAAPNWLRGRVLEEAAEVVLVLRLRRVPPLRRCESEDH